ncbi:hypothetical protein WJX74_008109 [Apatococcus lobatus]|uniref:DDT domain-containing protein n=1 Tax=Apatococcus lobatus TaxID=904363 RepID=A0AAW1QM34_9CHLO
MKGKENVQELLNCQTAAAGILSPASGILSAVPGTSTKAASLQPEASPHFATEKMPISPADSLSQRDASESPSDFSDAGDLLHDSVPSDGSDFEDGPASRKRKGAHQPAAAKSKKQRAETAMVKKLRSRAPEDQPEGTDASTAPAEEKAGTIQEDEDDFQEPADAPIERHVTVAQEDEERQLLRSNWELASIFSFLEAFGPHLRLPSTFTASELERALIISTGQSGLLAELHQALLHGINPRTNFLAGGGWQGALAGKLRYQWRARLLTESPPFTPEKGREAAFYAALDTTSRVTTLKTLCEMRLDCQDFVNIVDECGKVGRSGKANAVAAANAKRKGPPLPDYINLRPAPLGTSGKGHSFWLLDLHTLQDVRLYQEVPAGLTARANQGQGTGAKRKEPKPSRFEQVASAAEEFQAIGEQLSRSRVKADKQLSSKILDSIVPELAIRQEEEERRQKAAAKLRLQLDSIIPDDQGGFGRSRRTRKAVNYTFDAFDAEIKRAIRSDGQRQENDWPEPRSRRGQPEPSAFPKLSRAERAARRGGPEAESEPELAATEVEGEGEEAPAAPRFRPLGQLLEDPEPSEVDGDGAEEEADDAGAQQDAYYNMGAYSREDTPEGLYDDEEEEDGPEPSASDPSFTPSEPSSRPGSELQGPPRSQQQQGRLQYPPTAAPPQPAAGAAVGAGSAGQQQGHIKVMLRPGGNNSSAVGTHHFSRAGFPSNHAPGMQQQQQQMGLPSSQLVATRFGLPMGHHGLTMGPHGSGYPPAGQMGGGFMSVGHPSSMSQPPHYSQLGMGIAGQPNIAVNHSSNAAQVGSRTITDGSYGQGQVQGFQSMRPSVAANSPTGLSGLQTSGMNGNPGQNPAREENGIDGSMPQLNGSANHFPARAASAAQPANGGHEPGTVALKGNRVIDVPGTIEDEYEEYCRYGV